MEIGLFIFVKETARSKAEPPKPPPWFPPLESLFRGAPVFKESPKGETHPSQRSRRFVCVGSLLGASARTTAPGAPAGSSTRWVFDPLGLGFVFIFPSLSARKRPQWPPSVQVWPRSKLMVAGDFRPAKNAGAESPGLDYFSPPARCHSAPATKPTPLRFASADLWPRPPQRAPMYERKTDGVALPSGLQYVPIWL